MDNPNESISGSDPTVALGGLEAEGNPNVLLPTNQAKLTALTWEINELHQWVEAGEGQPAESLDCIELELQKSLSSTSTTTFPNTYWASQRSDRSVHRHLVHHTKANQSNHNSLLQDITVSIEYDSTKLEDWLTDIETVADLTTESWTKLTKAKLRELTHTLVIEAFISGKSWEEIKYLLWLKLCNTNMCTYTSCFMDIQQKEKESLAAYNYRFKTKAKRCNFTNDAATVRIFHKRITKCP